MIHDRVFWIYFIVTFFFIIIGFSSIIISNDPYMLLISIIWLLSNVALMIVIYHSSINWAPVDNNILICVVDSNSGCFDAKNRVWLFINILFIILLIFGILWAAELSNSDAGALREMSGVLILLGGLLLCGLIFSKSAHRYNTPFWVAVTYLIIWFGLTLYTILNPI